ncbi:unnamed protein product, partial [Adineta ricciae]
MEHYASGTMNSASADTDSSSDVKNEWRCQQCSMENEQSSTRCAHCTALKPLPANARVSTRSIISSVEDRDPAAVSSARDQEQGSYKHSVETPRVYPDLDPMKAAEYDTNGFEHNTSAEKKRSSQSEETQVEPMDTNNGVSADCPSSPKEDSSISVSTQSASNDECISRVYVTDLPLDIDDNHELEQKLRQRLLVVLRIEPLEVKCYSNFGIAYCRVGNNAEKEHLTQVVGKIAWDADDPVMVSFRETIEFISYIVFKRTKENNSLGSVTVNEIIRAWIDSYNAEAPIACTQWDGQYPNIYLIKTKALDELIRVTLNPNLVVRDQLAQIYPCAFCDFLEDLPAVTTENQLRDLICNAIQLTIVSPSSLCIELNKNMNNACIITTNETRKWAKDNFIYIDYQYVRKRKSLSHRLLVSPVCEKEDADIIVRDKFFAGKAKILYHLGQHLILKIHDKNLYDDCLNHATLKIGKDINVTMVNYLGRPHPNATEIDSYTWYDKKMLQCEPDIMPFLTQPDHKIFRLTWNAQVWLDQFNRLKTLQRQYLQIYNDNNVDDDKPDHTLANEMRHRLRVTVMLNTLAVIRNRSYTIDGKEFPLYLNDRQMTIVYNHKSILTLGGLLPNNRAPYEKTEVKVINEDCLIVYENYAAKGRKPLLLNMASGSSPGGGYRKGDGAQEENLFRRSDYFRSLDADLDQFIQPSSRFYCSSTGRFELLADPSTMYRMDEYGAIYTSGITAFRQPETEGYEFMRQPLTNVCSLAMAAYRKPLLEGNMLSEKFAVGTRKKIENIFAIAHHHKHDTLILSALGCGAFQNPPSHVAKIFRSVIEQYAGFFRSIVFAIVDDHNTGQKLNVNGNFLPFESEFQQSTFEAIRPINKPNTMFGPYRFSSDGSNVENIAIFDLTPCKYGAKCRELFEPAHICQYSHPSLCTEMSLTDKCTKKDDLVHMASFIHRPRCPQGGLCKVIDDKTHSREFEHPPYCSARSDCQDTSDKHEKEFRHLPSCKNAHKCKEYLQSVREHCNAYRHCRPSCPYGRSCVYFHDKLHIDDWQHPFPTPCPWTPHHCALYQEFQNTSYTDKIPNHVQQHCSTFAHVCVYGRDCVQQNASHWETTIHIPRRNCPDGKKCVELRNEDHSNSFTHSNLQDIRYS